MAKKNDKNYQADYRLRNKRRLAQKQKELRANLPPWRKKQLSEQSYVHRTKGYLAYRALRIKHWLSNGEGYNWQSFVAALDYSHGDPEVFPAYTDFQGRVYIMRIGTKNELMTCPWEFDPAAPTPAPLDELYERTVPTHQVEMLGAWERMCGGRKGFLAAVSHLEGAERLIISHFRHKRLWDYELLRTWRDAVVDYGTFFGWENPANWSCEK